MFNFRKIGILMLAAALFCILRSGDVLAGTKTNADGSIDCDPVCGTGYSCACVIATKKCECVKLQSDVGTNARQSQSAVTGCSSNQGIFSGLISTGSKVFNGLRDLIYVVAGFGIIGVAVGGFFGNLNWKWLGAIVISLVVIATTGELISAITGCENFTNAMITDTLK